MRAKTLQQLPSELLCHTLSFLDAYDLVRVRKTCRALKGIIDNSEMLQYAIDLGYFQMIPGSSETDVPTATRRKQLRLYDAARQRVDYKVKYTLSSSKQGLEHVYAFGGGIYGSAAEDLIHFTRLPSASDSGDIYSWSYPVDSTTFLNFTFCVAQDLLILSTRSLNLRSHAYEIHLKSLTTYQTHPDAAQPFLKVLDQYNVDHRSLHPRSHMKLQIIGNYVCMLCRAVISNGDDYLDAMQLWDWKSKNGYQFTFFFAYDISDYSFITEDRFLVFVTSGAMEIYSIVDKSKHPQRTASISLPTLVDSFEYTDVFMSQNPTPSDNFLYSRKSHQQPSCSFHPSGDDGLIVILVWVGPMREDHSLLDQSLHYRFVVRRSAILEFESSFVRIPGQLGSNSPRLRWSMWGPQNTSWFHVHDNEDWHTSLNGFRTVESVNESSPDHFSDDPRRLYIRDFNPHIAWNYSAVDKSGWRSEIIPAREVHGTISYPFTEPLGCALAYRESSSEELFDVSEILSDESRILLIRVSRNLILVPPGDNELR
ncbi:hypothetical protein DEU56DRAFT_858701 [Suillus clintonianus]|uniref:uncharacterized protein n=1 Tax=Suillus clintonianus TaxID=1904413 RepID=UPI001B85C38A|nr:uncharacterized protein DEU56DRAFT_858701 [Suillus clintonianus]KAG2134810.1 hypothetical protein DEU56DRAFT_858701 [Suillus clintonianus]